MTHDQNDAPERRDRLTEVHNRNDTDHVVDRTAAPDDDDVETGFDLDSIETNTGHTDVHDEHGSGRGD